MNLKRCPVKSGKFTSYIKRNKKNIGCRYPTILGVVRMSDDEGEWDFDGGFPKKFYAIVYTELCLSNQGFREKAVGFRSYSSINEFFEVRY